MRRWVALWLVLAWLLGVGSGLGYVALSGGWYTYHLPSSGNVVSMIEERGCEMPKDSRIAVLRCPRFRLP